MTTLGQTPSPVNFAAAEAAYKQASAAVDARIEYLDHHTSCTSWQKAEDRELLALIAAEESAYEQMFHVASERQRRARMMVSGSLVTDARDESSWCGWQLAALSVALALPAVLACSYDDTEPTSDEECVCDAFGPPGIFEPSTCNDDAPCCDYDDDGEPDASPTRLVCFSGGDK